MEMRGLGALYGLLILRHGGRQLLWLGVTADPTAEWLARQLTEAFGWEPAPEYLFRDRDGAYGEIFKNRLRAMGIRDRQRPRGQAVFSDISSSGIGAVICPASHEGAALPRLKCS